MIKINIRKTIMPLAMAFVLSATSMPMYMTQTAIVKAATANTFGTEGVKLAPGTYTVPLSLKNASNPANASMAAGAIGENGILTVDENGKATLEFTLQEVNIMGATGTATKLEVYQGNDTKSDKREAETLAKNETTGNPVKVRFDIPEAAKSEDGVYISMKIDAMGGANMAAFLKIDYASIAENNESKEKTVQKTVSISQFGGYDIKTIVTYKENKVTDLEVTGEKFEGSFAVPNQRVYLPKAVNKIKDQVIGLNIKDQTAFDSIDTVSGATTTATAIKNAVIESLGLTVKEEVLAEAPAKVKTGTYEIQIKNMTDTVEHSISASDLANKVTATLKVDQNGNMTLSYPVVTKEAMDVLAFNGYYKGNTLTKEGAKETKNSEDVVTNVNMPLASSKPEISYKANFKMYVPAMSGLNGTQGGITFDHGKFDTDATITLYWDTLKEIKTPVTAPSAPSGIKAVSADHDKVKITWNKGNSVAGYEVYQNNNKIADVKTNSYTKTKLTTGTKYTYKVRAYKLDGTKKVYSTYSKNVTATPALSTVGNVKVKNTTKKSAKITFKKVNGANGYIIYRASKKNGKYKAVKILKKATSVSYTNKKLKKKAAYYYKVRAYKAIGKKKVYSRYSKTVSVKINK